jgi:RNA polymerase sigma-70 factor (ECF subfamily)
MTLGQSFESVLEAAKLGADWAWAVLYGEIAGPVMGYFRTRGVSDPEEAAGDVFFELARAVDQFEGTEEAFRTLVFQVAYERLLVEKHNSRSRPRSVLADQVLDHLQRDISVMDRIATSGVPEELRRAFEVLSPAQRDVLSLRIVAGLSLEQTAQVIGSGIHAVKSLQRRGLAKVRGTVAAEAALV